MNNEKENLIEKLANGFESWDSFYSGLSIEQETEQDPAKLYESYITEYIKDALATIQVQARREGYMEAVDLIPDNMLDGYEAPGLMVQKVKDRLKAKLNNERDTYHFTKEESRQNTSN